MNESIFSSATSSISHVYGNVGRAIELHLKGVLPQGFIKDSYISTRVAYKHFQKYKNKDRDDGQLRRKTKPALIVRPVLEIMSPNDDMFLLGTAYTRNDHLVMGPGRDIEEFLKDKQRHYGVGFKINRYRMTFDIEIQLNTDYSSYDLYHYLLNSIVWEIPTYIHTPLESMIPKNILMTLGNYIGTDITRTENIPTFLRYLRSHSSRPITYMMQNSTSQNSYFLYYQQDLLATFTDLSVSEGERKGMIPDSVNLTFKISVDFNTPGNYYLYGNEKIADKLQSCIHFVNEPMNSKAYVPIFTYNIANFDNEFYLKGFTQYANGAIKTEKENDGKDDSFSLKQFIGDEDYQVCLDFMAQENPINLLFDIKLVKDIYDLDPEVDWEINWNNLTVTIHNSDMYATYRLIVYANLNLLNSRKLENNFEKTDQQTIDPKTNHGYNI